MAHLATAHGGLGPFGLAPPLPLDAGRAPRSLRELGAGRVAATRIAVGANRAAAIALGARGVLNVDGPRVAVARFACQAGVPEVRANRPRW